MKIAFFEILSCNSLSKRIREKNLKTYSFFVILDQSCSQKRRFIIFIQSLDSLNPPNIDSQKFVFVALVKYFYRLKIPRNPIVPSSR